MNAPTEAGAAQAANRGVARGRGRGGGRGGTPRTTTRTAVTKVTVSKIGPNRLLEVEWVKDSVLQGNCFVLWLGAGQAGDQQWTFHRPIGETSLSDRQWVATPTRDIGYLLQRRESEALTAWKRQSELAKRQAVLRAQRGRRLEDETEVWSFPDAPAIQPTIRTCMAAARAAHAPESAWLNYADRAVQVAEQQFKEALRTQGIPEGWIRANPKPVHETRGGPLGDRPQEAVPYLNGLSLAAARDKVTRVAIGVDCTEALDVPEDSESEDEEEDDPPANPPASGSPERQDAQAEGNPRSRPASA